MKKTDYKQNPMYSFLMLLTIASMAGLQGWRTLFNNFAVDVVGIDGFWVGVIQSVREIPGFLALLVIYILIVVREDRLSVLSIALMGIGILCTGLLPSKLGLIVTTLIMSTGFHYYETTNQSLTLQYFTQEQAPNVFASFRSISAISNIATGGVIWLMTFFFSMKVIFIAIGIAVLTIAIISWFKDPVDKTLPVQHKKMILKKKYWLFYVLNILSGARRQIFMVFAVLLLVEHYKFSVQTITILFVVNNIINYFFNPIVAKAINKFGEKAVLSVEYGSLIFIFLMYAFIENPTVAMILYIFDHLFFNFSIGIKTYFQKTANKKDIAPSMAVSFTINHITAVFLPVLGGVLWIYDKRIPFIAGAVLSVISLIFVSMMKISNSEK